jgi:hypothetical protein
MTGGGLLSRGRLEPSAGELFAHSFGLRRPVADAFDPGLTSAMGAAEEAPGRLDAVADHLASAVLAGGRQLVDGALEAVEDMTRTGRVNLERLVVVVATGVALRHGLVLLSPLDGDVDQRNVGFVAVTVFDSRQELDAALAAVAPLVRDAVHLLVASVPDRREGVVLMHAAA